MILFVLQNPWRRNHPARRWDNRVWEAALWRSQTGKRLREYIPNGAEVRVINANPIAAGDIRTVREPDVHYVQEQARRLRPSVIVLLGKVAAGLSDRIKLPIPILRFPHPCWRLLSKNATEMYREQIATVCARLNSD